MSDQPEHPKAPRYKVVILELIPADESNEVNEPALDTVEARIPQLVDAVLGATASATAAAEREPPLIYPDTVRDHEAEARIADRVREPLKEIAEKARARDHLRKAGQHVGEAALMLSVRAYVHAEIKMREAIARVHVLWKKYAPESEEVVRDFIVKEGMKQAIWAGLKKLFTELFK